MVESFTTSSLVAFSYRNPESRVREKSGNQEVVSVSVSTDASGEANRQLVRVSVECQPIGRIQTSGSRIGAIDVIVRLVNLSEHFDYELGLFARNAWYVKIRI